MAVIASASDACQPADVLGELDRVPEIRYALSGRHHIAYQVFGDGPVDLVFAGNWAHNVEIIWEWPPAAAFLRRLATFARVVLFDRRGTGLSDPVGLDETPTLDELVEDTLAVMNDAGVTQAAILSAGLAATLGIYLAVTHPERVESLVLYNATARAERADDYPIGVPLDVSRRTGEQLALRWGREPAWGLDMNHPWASRWQRLSLAPGAAAAAQRLYRNLDLRELLPSLRVRTLVAHTAENSQLRVGHGRYLAEHIEGSQYVELPGGQINWYGDENTALLDEIQEFLTGSRSHLDSSLVVASVVFTDVVDSTKHAAAMGDARWLEVRGRHFSEAQRTITLHRGQLVKTTGDGVLATFDSATRAIQCAVSIVRNAGTTGLSVRAGVHTGELEQSTDGDIAGISVHVAARVLATAGGGEVVATSTLKDLVLGSPLVFEPHGSHQLKGVPGDWHLWRVQY